MGGGVNPQSATKKGFSLRKEKKMQNVLKRKNMYFDKFFGEILCSFGPVLYLDYSESLDMNIEKLFKQKTIFCRMGGATGL